MTHVYKSNFSRSIEKKSVKLSAARVDKRGKKKKIFTDKAFVEYNSVVL